MPLNPQGKDTGWISKWAFQVGALAADVIGRQAIADAYFAATAAMRAKFADGFITAAKLASNAVETVKITAKAVTTATIDDKAVETGQIGDGAVDTLQLAAKAVEQAKIGDLAVDTGQLAANAVTFAKLATAQKFLIVRKTSRNQAVNNSTTFVNDTELKLPVLANERWAFALVIIGTSSADAHMKVGWVVPSGTAVYWSEDQQTLRIRDIQTDINVIDGSETVGKCSQVFFGVIHAGATPGDVQLRWAQNAARAENTRILEGSCIIAFQIV